TSEPAQPGTGGASGRGSPGGAEGHRKGRSRGRIPIPQARSGSGAKRRHPPPGAPREQPDGASILRGEADPSGIESGIESGPGPGFEREPGPRSGEKRPSRPPEYPLPAGLERDPQPVEKTFPDREGHGHPSRSAAPPAARGISDSGPKAPPH